ncbi:MAG: winged helix-turn-helix domain-containing protein [Pseudobacteriovorax sp.]|nr:winged helix-turn-helix domain-containing protein [Pseudobacteriovorax sp.]
MDLSKNEARTLFLKHQGLIGRPLDQTRVIRRLGYIQIDTISVVERAHHHVLWSRNSHYRPATLNRLVAQRQLFEYWSHAAAYLPMEDYRYSLPRKIAYRDKDSNWLPKNKAVMHQVLRRIEQEGPLCSKDFEGASRHKSGWGGSKPARTALERLFHEGHLMITSRESFQKVYDLPHRVIPNYVDQSIPSETELARHLIKKTLRLHGFAKKEECSYLQPGHLKSRIRREVDTMISEGSLIPIRIEGVEPSSYFASTDFYKRWPTCNDSVKILSPFDHAVIQRKKLWEIFDFKYTLECYLPREKRQYGYFVLPILWQDRFVGRMDCKASRKEKRLIIQNLQIDPKTAKNESFQFQLQKALGLFTTFNGCQDWTMASPTQALPLMRSYLAKL